MAPSSTPDAVTPFSTNGGFDAAFAAHLEREVREQLPAEKLRERLKQIEIYKAMNALGPAQLDGVGQRIGVVSARTFFRWQQEFPGCWQDPDFVKRMLRDNPQMCAPGYRPADPGKIFV